MPSASDRQIARLRARYTEHATQLGGIGLMLKGSVTQRFLPCGSAGCRCHSDPTKRHGPYWQWSSKVKGKTVTRMLTEEQVGRYEEWIGNWKRFQETVEAMHDIASQAEAVLAAQERTGRGGPDRPPPSRRPPGKSRATR
jgi:hypothetical protein